MLKRLFGRIKCEHEYIEVCIWHVVDGDFGAEGYDGAYTNFCMKCFRFGPELLGIEMDRDSFVYEKPTSWKDIPKALASWFPLERWRWMMQSKSQLDEFRLYCDLHGYDLRVEYGVGCRNPVISIVHKIKGRGGDEIRPRPCDPKSISNAILSLKKTIELEASI